MPHPDARTFAPAAQAEKRRLAMRQPERDKKFFHQPHVQYAA
jgi:hypothetical protein